MNETNLKRKEVRQCKKRQKRHESPQGGWGMGSKEPIWRKILLFTFTISVKLFESSWFLYRMKPRLYKFPKILKLWSKGRPLGGFRVPKATFEHQLLLFPVIHYKNKQYYLNEILKK